MRRKLGSLVLTTAFLAACGGGDEFADATPETAAYQMELTGDQSEGLTTASADWGDGPATQALTGPLPEYLQHTRDAIRALNDAVADVLKPVEEAIAADAKTAAVGDTKTYGPHDKGAATFLFTIKKLAPKSFGWKVDAKPLGAQDSAYVTVMGGLFHAGDQPRRGEGAMGVDLDKLASVDADFHGNGQMLVGFAHVAGFKVLAYGLHNFSPDVNQFDPIDAVFTGWKGPDGGAHVRLATYANIADSPTDAKELVLLHARWLPLVGGRADGLVTKGDVPDGHVLVANSCWSRDLTDVDGFYLIRDCAVGAISPTCTVIKTAGKPSNCARGVDDEELPPSDPMDATPESGAPMSPAIPTAMPSN
jgi:hypothetical protein